MEKGIFMLFNESYFYELAKDILTTPSPSGYTHQVIEKVKAYADDLGLKRKQATFRGPEGEND